MSRVVWAAQGRLAVCRYEDGQEVLRRPGCLAWCDRDQASDYSLVWHDRTIGTITEPDGGTVGAKIVREQRSQDVVTVGGR